MGFGPFVLISLFYVVVGVRVVAQLARSWRQTFDRRFTPADRSLVDQTAFFILLPISVALHELGHAVAIWLFGGSVESWGYYGFAGFVGYDPSDFSRAERIWVAAAGTIVNLLLAAGALAAVFARRRPMRAAFNQLLFQFTLLSLLNALVVYPLLDLASGLNGDWSQMYRGGVPALSAAIGVVHVAILGLVAWAWRGGNGRIRTRIAALTSVTDGTTGSYRRIPLGGQAAVPDRAATGVEGVLREAAGRVASGWPSRVEGAVQRRSNGTLLVLSWLGGDLPRSVFAWAPDSGGVEFTGAVGGDGLPATRRPLAREAGPPDADRLTLALRLAMETVEAWSPASAPSRSS